METSTIGNLEILLKNLNKIHTTPIGVDRIKRNLHLSDIDVVDYCKKLISSPESNIYRQGKNWYCEIDSTIITVNAKSYTIITAHRK